MSKVAVFYSKVTTTHKLRFFIIGVLSILTLIALVLTDPDLGIVQQLPFGASTLNLILSLAKISLFFAALQICMWTILEEANNDAKLSELFSKITNVDTTGIASSIALVAIGLFSIAVAIIIQAVIAHG